ncbi:precorrin-3B C(17)-methyltransferase [Sorangium cellulosum]|uniref:Precorrin-3B C(17)-methyltransferase n=1 Tax=Sorangium cellulosum TaxID=56 RepID=A0A150PUE1_SORCE|nr:precorrin-3B C(17)-methyltransferase [Sorangium cellulosum]
MARVGRLGGAILAETQGEYYLIGNTKVPCDFREAGFEPPDQVELVKGAYLRLKPLREVKVQAPALLLDVEGEELAKKLVQRFVIDRNGSVSERLWRLVYSPDDPLDDAEAPVERDARWLGDIPEPIWQLVRDNVLRCL